MNPLFVCILLFIVGGFILDVTVEFLNLSTLNKKIPQPFEKLYQASSYQQTQSYQRTQTYFGLVQGSVFTLLAVFCMIRGDFNTLDLWARAYGFSTLITGLIYLGGLGLIVQIISLPFSLFHTFVIEERYGFNKMTVVTFISDLFKGILLMIIIGGSVLAVTLKFFESFSHAWLYVWGFIVLVQLFLVYISPNYIMPLFNQFTPIEDASLRERIFELSEKLNFPISEIYVMDGSKRSSKANAFFTGFGQSRRVVFYDTLLDQLNQDEILAVLAHEIGHYKHQHLLKTLLISILILGLDLLLLNILLNNEMLFDAFKMSYLSYYASFVFFGFLFIPLQFLTGVFKSYISRRHEFQADAFAVKSQGKPDKLISGLKKLSVNHMSHLTPHPLKVFLEYSHPPILNRIEAMKKVN